MMTDATAENLAKYLDSPSDIAPSLSNAELLDTLQASPKPFDSALSGWYVHITDKRNKAAANATRVVYVRNNGKCQTWKKQPGKFRQPAKYGLRDTFQITPDNAHRYHATEAEALASEPGQYIDC